MIKFCIVYKWSVFHLMMMDSSIKNMLLRKTQFYVSGKILKISNPLIYDFSSSGKLNFLSRSFFILFILDWRGLSVTVLGYHYCFKIYANEGAKTREGRRKEN